jgi:putative flippase GtrA
LTPIARRWLRFNAVGAAGAVVQLVALWLMVRGGVPKPIAAAFAVEAAVIHNFLWHQSWTWGGSLQPGNALRRFVRFNISNGAVSIAGNAFIMWILATQLGMPFLVVNVFAILVCSAFNFASSDRFVFRS